MTGKLSMYRDLTIERCNRILEQEATNRDRALVSALIKAIKKIGVNPYHIGVIERLEKEYGIHHHAPTVEEIKSMTPDLSIVYVKNSNELPDISIGWSVNSPLINQSEAIPFDVDVLYKLGQDFSEKMKVDVPTKVYILGSIAFFEYKKEKQNGPRS